MVGILWLVFIFVSIAIVSYIIGYNDARADVEENNKLKTFWKDQRW